MILKKARKNLLVTLLILGVSFVVWQFYKGTSDVNSVIIADIAQLAEIIKRVDARCKIIGFSHEKNNIDFLHLSTVPGRQVNALIIDYPEQWQGPYLKRDLKIQGAFYQIVQTRTGYFIVPGQGVRLDSGKIIGRDIMISKETDLGPLMQHDGLLTDPLTHKPLAAQLAIYASWLNY